MTTAYDFALLLLRVVLGLTMAAHGYNKFFGKGGLSGTAGWFDSIGMKPGIPHPRRRGRRGGGYRRRQVEPGPRPGQLVIFYRPPAPKAWFFCPFAMRKLEHVLV